MPNGLTFGSASPLEVVESGSTLALVPTYTTVSRQAIFAGDLPLVLPRHALDDAAGTPTMARGTGPGEGIAVTGVAYHRVKGRLPHDHLGFGDAPVNGVVVNAVDDLMHTSELFGDAQLLANLDVWADNGFLVDLVQRATRRRDRDVDHGRPRQPRVHRQRLDLRRRCHRVERQAPAPLPEPHAPGRVRR